MQTLIILNKLQAVVQNADSDYYESYENYLQDGGIPLPDGVESIDYNKDCNVCSINGKHFCKPDSKLFAKIFDLLPELRVKQGARNAKTIAYAREHVTDSLSLEEHKSYLLDLLAKKVAEFEEPVNKQLYFVSVLGFRCNGDRRTALNLQGLIDSYTDVIAYKTYDNELVNVNESGLKVLLKEHAKNVQELYHQKWNFESKINKATTKEELSKICFSFLMSDFS